ncbi:MAG: hypothetical protein P4L81_04130 [Candidatus Pacebacteria bacterium]|nr:hypothetical protein [Candidatus Paceibacterota bacterium]
MFGKRSNGQVVAIALIESGSAGIALLKTGQQPELLAHAREELALEVRSKEAQLSGVLQALATAGEKVLAEYTKVGKKAISTCYVVVGSPWSRSFSGSAGTKLDRATAITDAMISELAKQALETQKDIDRANFMEASVSRILLNGYPASDPAAKRAQEIDVFTLISDCDKGIKTGATEALAKLFPGTSILWRSSARADLVAATQIDPSGSYLIVEMDGEATDLISVHKGVLDQRVLVEQGVRQIMDTLAKGKPAAETITLMDMLEKDECDDAACTELRDSIAKAEPELVHVFGEALAKVTAGRKLPDELILIVPPSLAPWLSRFFARIDFTQFTATTRSLTAGSFTVRQLSGVPKNEPSLFTDADLCIACNLVNTELSS